MRTKHHQGLLFILGINVAETAMAEDGNHFRKKGMKGTIGTEGVVVQFLFNLDKLANCRKPDF